MVKKRLDVVIGCKRYIFKFLDSCFKQTPHWRERKSTIFVRHDLYKKEWEAIGKILAKGNKI